MVGIAGLVGAGKSELCKTIFGAYKKTGGKVMLKNRELKIANPSGAVKTGWPWFRRNGARRAFW